jgi:hypothetical protein
LLSLAVRTKKRFGHTRDGVQSVEIVSQRETEQPIVIVEMLMSGVGGPTYTFSDWRIRAWIEKTGRYAVN